MNACEVCGEPTSSKYGVCQRTKECRRQRQLRYYEARGEAARAASAKYREANRETALASTRRWKQKADRPCRFAKAGCTETSAVGQVQCAEHGHEENLRRYEERISGLVECLAELQDYVCAECGKLLPDDLEHVEADHIIPYSSGTVIHDYWNRQAVHARRNRIKNARCEDRDYQKALKRYGMAA